MNYTDSLGCSFFSTCYKKYQDRADRVIQSETYRSLFDGTMPLKILKKFLVNEIYFLNHKAKMMLKLVLHSVENVDYVYMNVLLRHVQRIIEIRDEMIDNFSDALMDYEDVSESLINILAEIDKDCEGMDYNLIMTLLYTSSFIFYKIGIENKKHYNNASIYSHITGRSISKAYFEYIQNMDNHIDALYNDTNSPEKMVECFEKILKFEECFIEELEVKNFTRL